MGKLKVLLASAAIAASVSFFAWSSGAAYASMSRTGGYVPIEIIQLTGNNSAGSVGTYRVKLNGNTDVNQPVAITCTESTAYSSLPSSVTVLQGTDTVVFTGTVSNNPPGSWILRASANGSTVSLGVLVPPPAK